MKQILSFLLVFFGCLQAQTWQQIPDFPGVERDDGVAFVINGKGYCGSGFKTGYSLTADFYSLDLSNNTWSVAASLPAGQERQYACAVSYSGKGYLFGGYNGGYFNDLWCYDPALNSWTQLNSKPGAGLSGSSCFVIGTVMYIIGGTNASTYASSEVWSYDFASSAWAQKNNLPFNGCWRASAAALNNKGYLIFGKDVNLRFRKELYEYDPGADNWTLKGNFPNAGRVYASMQNVNNQLTVFAGLDTLN
ncbi:MAG: Kelch repeat-containing protein, partial [Bacteroidia bacterium]